MNQFYLWLIFAYFCVIHISKFLSAMTVMIMFMKPSPETFILASLSSFDVDEVCHRASSMSKMCVSTPLRAEVGWGAEKTTKVKGIVYRHWQALKKKNYWEVYLIRLAIFEKCTIFSTVLLWLCRSVLIVLNVAWCCSSLSCCYVWSGTYVAI